MSIRKEPNGRWRAKLKSDRVDVASRTFDTKREAQAWHSREQAALDGGIDPRAGRERVRVAIVRWLEVRKVTVAQNTETTDRNMQRNLPSSLGALQISAVSDREIHRCFVQLLASGLAEASVVRFRASLSSFFAWCVREKLITSNPVTGVRVPQQSDEVTELHPFPEALLEEVVKDWAQYSQHLADVMLVLGWTGLRWAEARALRVGDIVDLPTPGLMLRRSQPEGNKIKATKGRSMRRVPLANRVLPIVRKFAAGKEPDDLLLVTESGTKLHRTPVVRTLHWSKTSRGRRIHDLRHTAAGLWLSRGVDAVTVQAWMGHESIATTNRYLHYLGTGADIAGLERLNRPSGGARGARDEKNDVEDEEDSS